MDFETIKLIEIQQAMIIGETDVIKKSYPGHEPLILIIDKIESCVNITMDYLKIEREIQVNKGIEDVLR